ncbi:hypothetical protein DSCO28_18520 [Desulfosarcina ovata subsp. sediminis]|uniref:DUF362 domain-containing protein n=2 Tax=Desulfosarcina ovata TaxID=83564 RepID=A0A5K7ZJT5_9BACT|nr:hypothetical protein DSCO28_18520 [Desulfosarcina ovata subsp. sediminis]
MISRRHFLKYILVLKMILPKSLFAYKTNFGNEKHLNNISIKKKNNSNKKTIFTKDNFSTVFKIIGGTAEENMACLIEQIGGIENIIGKNDIVVLKPNAQWTMQGMTNTDAMKAFIEVVLESKGYQGEIIIAENNQLNDFNGSGWSTDKPNGQYNYNDLIKYFKHNGYNNVTSYHWRCAGPNPDPIEGDDDGSGAKRVSGPADGDGYVWRDDIVYISPENKKCWMTYPIFTSKYSGITIDLKNGAWKDGKYLEDRKVKFINFSAINHHSFYCGVTASVKNLMGVVDMSCGFQGPIPEDIFNVHFIGVKKYIKYRKKIPTRYLSRLRSTIYKKAYENFHYTGAALGKFIKDIRMPDLNIITAHWIGWGSRWDKNKSSYPMALLASHDPVALDYVAAKDVLFPETPNHEEKIKRLNNPDIKDGPFYKFLRECHLQGIGNLGEEKIKRIEVKLG